ncbi:hypothetical protein [Bacillus sp. FJAT-52991]|uniref:Uncharacterized protein n=1 Tax=Bacillus kandeliae TaxID=3129297 RepID=A0ABZ2NBF8_9BACI
MTAVIYKLKSKKVSLDENVGYMSFIVDNSDPSKVTYQFLRVLNLNKGKKHVLFSQDGIDRIDYIVNAETSELESGWIITNENKKLDVQSNNYQEYINKAKQECFTNDCNKNSTLSKKASFSSCMDKCLSRSGVPKWLRDLIVDVTAVSCIFGPNPVCLAALTQFAALKTSDAIRCVGACAKK